MLRPIAGQWQVSLPMEAYPTNRLARSIERSFGALALLACGATWALAYGLGDGPDPSTVLAASSVGLLVPSLIGLWLMRQAEDAPRLTLARIYESVLRRLAQGDRAAVPHAQEHEGYVALAGVLGDFALLTRKLRGFWSRDTVAAGQVQAALNVARGHAKVVADKLGEDAAAIHLASAEAEREAASLARSVGETVKSCDWTAGTMNNALSGVVGLTEAVAATTVNIRRMAEQATRLSQDAHGAQVIFAGLDEKVGKVDEACAQIGRAAGTLGALVSASLAAAQAGIQGADLESVGPEILGFVGSITVALEETQSVLRAIMAETAEATRRVGEIDALVQSQHETGAAMSQAVDRQGAEIGRILKNIYEARSGFTALREGVDAVSRAGATRTQAVATLRHAAGNLPTHADAVANLLRDIPDFRPSRDF